MGPLILAAAALFLTGCGAVRFRNSRYSSEDLTRSSSPAEPMESDPKAQWAYSEFKKLKVPDKQLDLGCMMIDYDRPGPNGRRVGAGDGKVWPCEVYERALNNYETFYPIARGIAEGPLPGELTDHDPSTDFDEKVRRNIHAAVTDLKSDPRLKIAEHNPYIYQERLAVGLFYFTLFPAYPELIGPKNRKALEEFTQELEELGLGAFRESLFQYGGLGLLDFTGEEKNGNEKSALEALRTRDGECTERSKILYGVFKQAGLEPFFVATNFRYMKPILKQHNVPLSIYDRLPIMGNLRGHVYIGLALPDSKVIRYFDPTLGLSNVTYANYYHLGMMQFLGLEYNNRAQNVFNQERFGSRKAAQRLITQALRFDPDQPTIQYNHEVIFFPDAIDEVFRPTR